MVVSGPRTTSVRERSNNLSLPRLVIIIIIDKTFRHDEEGHGTFPVGEEQLEPGFGRNRERMTVTRMSAYS